MNRLTNLPLSSNQKRLWIVEQHEIENPEYNIGLTYHIKGSIDCGIFNRSIQILFDRHHSMFSVFLQNDAIVYIDIMPRDVKVELLDFSNMPAEKRKNEILSFAGADAGNWFDLETGPLFRLYLLRYSDSEYYFHATIHHIVFDGWSRQIFVDELSSIYTDLYNGVGVSLKPVEYQSYDFAGQDLVAESGRNSEELKKFWTENLKGFNNNALSLPFDRQRSRHSTGLGQVGFFNIPENIITRLKELAGKKGTTSLFQIMTSTLGLFLHKITGDDDICIGIPVSTRKYNDKMARLIGFFVDTTVARFRFDRSGSFIDFFDDAVNVVRAAVKNSSYSFERIVEALNPARIPGVNPYFQVTLSWVTGMTYPMDLGGIVGERVLPDRSATPFDLAFYMSEKDNSVQVELIYSSDLFNTDTIQRLIANYLKLLDVMTHDPHSILSSLNIISDRELKMITTVNETTTEYSQDKTILSLFEERVVLDPYSVALVNDSRSVTYKELDNQAARLAAVLQKQGMQKGDFIGIMTERSPELIACLLAIFKIGAAYVPLNISDPDDRTNSIISASKLKYVITSKSVKNSFPDIVCLSIEELLDQSAVPGLEINEETLLSTDPAYIIFTSGTTGIPKGVLVNHKSVINIIEWVNNTFSVSKGDKLLWVTNLGFDLSVYDIFGILAAGATIRILNDDDRMDPKKQYEILKHEEITFWDSAPQSLQQVMPYFNNNDNVGSFNNFRLVFLSGDWIPLTMPDAIRSVFSEAVVVCLGGATEATVWSNYFIVDKIDKHWKSIPYGKPIQNSRYYILNPFMGHCRIGEPGDLYIGGGCLAMGYYNDPELTSKRFIDDPFNKSSRLYFTGDKARWMADGNIEFLGREDDQIKVRGYRVELGEIRKAVMNTGIVKDAILIPDRTDKYNNKIILFVISEDESAFEKTDLIKELRKILPGYMVPEKVFNYHTFPATKNGKTDTKALFETYLQSVKDSEQTTDISDVTKPGGLTAIGETIYKIWKEILNRSNLQSNENFFNAGGNSLMVITTINRIKERFGVKLSFTEFLSNPTIELLSAFLESRERNDGENIMFVRADRTTKLPLTRNQKRLWFLLKMNPDLPIYTIHFGCRISGPFSAELFEKSLKLLLKEQSIMNTVLKEVDGEPYADIVKREPGIEFSDYSGLPENERSRLRDAIIKTASIPVFDLENGPLYKSNLVKIDDNEHFFQIAIHHIIFDGWSQSILTKRLSDIYNALLEGREIDSIEQEYNQYDFALWENNKGSSPNDETDLSFWKETLKGCPSFLKLPYDFKRPQTNSGLGSYETLILTGETTKKLRALSDSVNASIFSSMLGITGIFLSKLTGESDLNIGLPVAYRPHSKLEGIFGMFVNTVVVRLLFTNNHTFRDLLYLSHTGALDAVAHSAFPFEEIVNTVNPERMTNVNPLFQAAFSWQNDFNTPLSIKDPVCEILKPEIRSVPFDIIFSFQEEGDTVAGEIEYSVDLFRRETICNMKEIFLELVERLVNEPDTPILSLPVISEQGIRDNEAFNNTRTSYPSGRSVAELFKEQAALHRDKDAVVFRGDCLTYRDLDILSDQIAATLRGSGLTGNSPVAIFGDKTPEIIAAIIGILKAGGIYVPVDPEYPEERISFIVRDSGCKIILVQQKYSKHNFENITKIEIATDYHLSGGSAFTESEVYAESAYIMYTSGTSGKPKGSLIPQRGIIRLVRNTNYIDLTPEDRILMTGALVFDASTFEIWGALLNGGTLYIAEKESILDPDALGKELLDNKITVLWLTSGLFTQIAEIRTDIFSGLKYLLVGGDVLSAPHINKVRHDNPYLKVINGYGPTENTTFSITYHVDKDHDHSIPIGRPVSNSTAYIFDSKMNLLPPGIIGELYVGGDGLSMGYLNREDLNIASFTDNPYNPGEKIYRTGDLARWMPDGNIEFHGRRDNQVKIRGYRVEPDEVEAAISDFDEVIETVVKPIKMENGDVRLIAFMNVTERFTSTEDDLRKKLKAKLPAYMIPSAFSIMKGFPKTINGKTDRKALVYNTSDVIAPTIIEINFTPSEKIIYEIWSEALKKKDIRLTDNFFDIGGNSLMAISVFSKIQKGFNKDLKLRLFFDSPRIKDIAEACDLMLYDKTPNRKRRGKASQDGPKIISGELY